MADFDPIRVKPGELTFAPLFPSATPQPPQVPQPTPEQAAQAEEARRRDEELARWHTEQERAAPGRYEVLDQRDLAARQERWKRERASGGMGGDMARLGRLGFDSTANSLRELVRAIPGVGKHVVAGVDAIDRWTTGRDSETIFEESRARQTAELTPEMRSAREKKWVDERQNADGSTSYSMGSAWSDPRSYLAGLTESAVSTAVTMVPGAALARGAYLSAMAKGAGERAAAAAASRTAMIAGGLSEGAIAGGQTSAEVREQIAKLPEETLRQSEAYRALLDSGMTPERARAALADDRATPGMIIAGVATGVFGGMGDRALAKIVAEGVQGGLGRRLATGAARGAVAEGLLEELPQSVGEQVAQNYAVRGADPNRRLMQDVPNAAAGGAVVGGMMGAGFGAGGARRSSAESQAPAEPAGIALDAPESPAEARGREVAAGTAAPSGPLSAAVDYASRQTGAAPTTAPGGAPAVGSAVQVQMPRGAAMAGVIEGYSADGEPMVRAEMVDPETGEVRTDTLQVPLDRLAPVQPPVADGGQPLEMAGRSGGPRAAPAPAPVAVPEGEQAAPPAVQPPPAEPAGQPGVVPPAPVPVEPVPGPDAVPPPVAPPVPVGEPAVIPAAQAPAPPAAARRYAPARTGWCAARRPPPTTAAADRNPAAAPPGRLRPAA